MKTRLTTPLVAAALLISGANAPAQTSIDGQKLTALQRVARLKTLRSKGKSYEAEAVYPVFRARTPLSRYANAQISSRTRVDFAAWVRDTRAQIRESPTDLPYDYSVAPAPNALVTPRLISLCLDNYAFDGGAHGMTISNPLNFGLVSGRPKLLSLGDFFRPGTRYRALVESRIFAHLRKNPNAVWVQDKSVKTLATEQFNSFTAERDGLRWIFNQYEMGPYAAGPIEVKLPLAELGAGFRRELLR